MPPLPTRISTPVRAPWYMRQVRARHVPQGGGPMILCHQENPGVTGLETTPLHFIIIFHAPNRLRKGLNAAVYSSSCPRGLNHMAKNPRNPTPPAEEPTEDERSQPDPKRVAAAKDRLQEVMTRCTHALADGENTSLKVLAVRAVRAGLPFESVQLALDTVQEAVTDALNAAIQARDEPAAARKARVVSRVDRVQL